MVLLLQVAAAALCMHNVILAAAAASSAAAPKWRDVTLSAAARTSDLIPRLNMTQKSWILNQQSAALELKDGSGTLPAVYNVECLHGTVTKYVSTVFPTPITQAATFDPALAEEIGRAIADTLRAGWNEGKGWPYCFAPDINLVRDPRYGRGQETWGEDPWLVSQFGKAFVSGLQTLSPPSGSGGGGSGPPQPEVGATCKHLIAYDHSQGYTNAKVDAKNLFESYIPGWEGCAGPADKGGADALSIMCSYGLFGGVPTCGSDYLLNTVMRGTLGFGGLVVSDCGAVQNMCNGNWTTQTDCSRAPYKDPTCHRGKCMTTECEQQCLAAAAAAAINNGMDMACGDTMNLQLALDKSWTTELDIDRALHRTLKMRMQLGMYDRPEDTRWGHLKLAELQGCAAHKALALRMGRESVVLLQNQNGVLPIPKTVGKLAVVGPLADNIAAYDGEKGYRGASGYLSTTVTAWAGIKALLTKAATTQGNGRAGPPPCTATPQACPNHKGVTFCPSDPAAGQCTRPMPHSKCPPCPGPGPPGPAGLQLVKGCSAPCSTPGNVTAAALAAAVAAAKASEYTVAVLGHDTYFESESRDRLDNEYGLPPPQLQLLQAIAVGAPQTKLVLVLINGLAIGIPWAKKHVPAIIEGLRGGKAAGTALAEVLFGLTNPSGRLPYTVVATVDQLPPYEAMDITAGRTYRYYGTTNLTALVAPLWLFGDGLSYTEFAYSELNLSAPTIPQCSNLTVTVTVTNRGSVAGSEVAQLYVTNPVQLMPSQRQQHSPGPVQPDVDPTQTNFDNVRPLWQLAGVRRVADLAPGASSTLAFSLNARSRSVVYADGRRYLEHGPVILRVGGSSPAGLAKAEVKKATVQVAGAYPLELEKCPATARNIV